MEGGQAEGNHGRRCGKDTTRGEGKVRRHARTQGQVKQEGEMNR